MGKSKSFGLMATSVYPQWNPSLLEDSGRLRQFVEEYFGSDLDEYVYDQAILDAIKACNSEALDILWWGQYHYDISSPCYFRCMRAAAEFSDLPTFKKCYDAFVGKYEVCLHGHANRVALEKLAEKNTHEGVLAFIKTLPKKIMQAELVVE